MSLQVTSGLLCVGQFPRQSVPSHEKMVQGAYNAGQQAPPRSARERNRLEGDLRGIDTQPGAQVRQQAGTEGSIFGRIAISEPCAMSGTSILRGPIYRFGSLQCQMHVPDSRGLAARCDTLLTHGAVLMTRGCSPSVELTAAPTPSATTPEEERPPQTPNSSTAAGAAQQRPPASSAPAQHAPVKSTTAAVAPAAALLPMQAPQAFRRPLAQHCPLRSSVAAPVQQAPPSLTTPAPHARSPTSRPVLAVLLDNRRVMQSVLSRCLRIAVSHRQDRHPGG